MHRATLLSALIASAFAASIATAADPVYFTAFTDPCRGVEAHRLVRDGTPLDPALVTAGGTTRSVTVAAVPIPGTSWVLHRAMIGGLEPEQEFTVAFAQEPARRLRTLATTLDKPLRIANGGDTMHRAEWFAGTSKVMLARNPDLVVFGGDLAYEDGKDGERAALWIRTWSDVSQAPDGRTLAFVSCIGNHEVVGHYGGTPETAPFFFAMMPLANKPLRTVDIGDAVRFILLDSGHVTWLKGDQPLWLQTQLDGRRPGQIVVPVYHYPAYPTVKGGKQGEHPYENWCSKEIRELWVPRFEAAGVRLALEHDQHVAKRTVPLTAGKPDTNGITYLGDGAWGVETRKIWSDLPHMAMAESVRHGWWLEFHRDRIEAECIDETGKVFDRTTIPLARRE